MRCYVPAPLPRVAAPHVALRRALGRMGRHAVVAGSVAAGGTGSGLIEVACSRAMADVHRELRASAPDPAGNNFRDGAALFSAPPPSVGTPVWQLPGVPKPEDPALPTEARRGAGADRDEPVPVPVPEPPTLLLVLLALCASIWAARRP